MNKRDRTQISNLLDQRLGKQLQPIHEELKEHGKILKQHTKQLKSLKKDQSTMLAMLDREQSNQAKRIKRIEDHISIPA